MMDYLVTTKNATVDSSNIEDILMSYDSKVLCCNHLNHSIILGRHWQYSVTTKRHIRLYFEKYLNSIISIKELRKAISDGFITLSDGFYTVTLDPYYI